MTRDCKVLLMTKPNQYFPCFLQGLLNASRAVLLLTIEPLLFFTFQKKLKFMTILVFNAMKSWKLMMSTKSTLMTDMVDNSCSNVPNQIVETCSILEKNFEVMVIGFIVKPATKIVGKRNQSLRKRPKLKAITLSVIYVETKPIVCLIT